MIHCHTCIDGQREIVALEAKVKELEQQLTDGGKLVYAEYKRQQETIEYLKGKLKDYEREKKSKATSKAVARRAGRYFHPGFA